MNCPRRMDGQTFTGNYGKTVPLDLCHTCHGIWFDKHENLQLSLKQFFTSSKSFTASMPQVTTRYQRSCPALVVRRGSRA